MTDATITVIATGTGLVITAIGGVIVSVINAKLTKLSEKADVNAGKTQEIRTFVDGNLSRVTAELGVAHKEIEGLTKLVASLAEEKKATAAQTENVLVAAVSKAPPNVAPPAVSKARESTP